MDQISELACQSFKDYYKHFEQKQKKLMPTESDPPLEVVKDGKSTNSSYLEDPAFELVDNSLAKELNSQHDGRVNNLYKSYYDHRAKSPLIPESTTSTNASFRRPNFGGKDEKIHKK